jgi:hypothetical protein
MYWTQMMTMHRDVVGTGKSVGMSTSGAFGTFMGSGAFVGGVQCKRVSFGPAWLVHAAFDVVLPSRMHCSAVPGHLADMSLHAVWKALWPWHSHLPDSQAFATQSMNVMAPSQEQTSSNLHWHCVASFIRNDEFVPA